jgi:hypothetical protein
MITLDPEFIGQLAEPGHVPFTTPKLPFGKKPRLDRLRELGKADESPGSEEDQDAGEGEGDEEKRARREDKEKMKMRGKGKSMKRYLKKKRKNVIDPSSVRTIRTLSPYAIELRLIYTMILGRYSRKDGEDAGGTQSRGAQNCWASREGAQVDRLGPFQEKVVGVT